jgi:hypothetical protein
MTHIRLVRDVFHTCYHQTFIVVWAPCSPASQKHMGVWVSFILRKRESDSNPPNQQTEAPRS